MFQHVICAYPYRRELDHAGYFPPLGLEIIATVLCSYSRALDIVDLRKEAGRTQDFLRQDTDMVCFSVNWDREAGFVRQEILSVPPGIFTVLGGRHATEDPMRWLSNCPNVDAIVRGDGEEVMQELCRDVPLEEIAGLSFRRNGEIFHNINRTLGAVKDDLYPDRSLRRYTYEIAIERVGSGIPIDTISASRGCPFNCTFCSFSHNPWGEKREWSRRSPESVVGELAEIEARIVGFTDDLFTLDMDHVERICDLILARGIQKKYLINARLEIARRPDILRKMEKAGFVLLMLGIESAYDKTLRSMRKGFDVAKIREYFKVLKNSTMILHGYFILGNVGESIEEMEQMTPFAHELGLDTIAYSSLRASPHSGLDDLVAKTSGYHIAPNGKIYSDHCSLEELNSLRRQLLRQFYTKGQFLRLTRKAFQNDVLSFLPSLLLRVPKIFYNAGTKSWNRAKQRRAERTF